MQKARPPQGNDASDAGAAAGGGVVKAGTEGPRDQGNKQDRDPRRQPEFEQLGMTALKDGREITLPRQVFSVPCSLGPSYPVSLLFSLDERTRPSAYSRTMAQVVRYSVYAHGTGFLWILSSFVFCLLLY